MQMQKKILEQFQEVYKRPTLKESKEITGIHPTRFFRLMNGYPMKLNEYELISDAIIKRTKEPHHHKAHGVLNNLLSLLSEKGTNSLIQGMERKISLCHLIENNYNSGVKL